MKKKIIAGIVALSIATPAMADSDDIWWALGGILVGSAIANQNKNHSPQEASPPPRPEQLPHYYKPGESRPIYKFVDVYVPECRCYQSVMVRIN
mgnify:CR=1 FL=1